MSRRSWPKRHARLALALLGLLFFVPSTIASNSLAGHQQWLARRGARTTAFITAVTCGRGGCGDHARITFETPRGRVSTTITLVESATVGPGSRIPIAYDPARPADARSMEGNFSLPMREMGPALGLIFALALWLVAGAWTVTRLVHRLRRGPLVPSSG
jgi:hypothetical protein